MSVTLQNVGPEAFRQKSTGDGARPCSESQERSEKTGGPASLNTSARAPTSNRTHDQPVRIVEPSLYDTNGTKIKPSQFKAGSAKGEVEAIKDKFNLQVATLAACWTRRRPRSS